MFKVNHHKKWVEFALHLQPLPQPLDLLQHKVHVCLSGSWCHHSHTEEVREVPERLVANHHGALQDHSSLDPAGGGSKGVGSLWVWAGEQRNYIRICHEPC